MRLIDGDYLYNKLVANKCPYDLVLQMVKDEPTVCDIEQIRAEIEEYKSTIDNAISEDELKIEGMQEAYNDCLEIIDKYTK